ncbi:MAG TPA: hypothetical protein VJJ55_00170 [Candidatus Paceibacterota bacterium]
MIGYEYEFLVREGDTPLTKATFLKFHEELKKREIFNLPAALFQE